MKLLLALSVSSPAFLFSQWSTTISVAALLKPKTMNANSFLSFLPILNSLNAVKQSGFTLTPDDWESNKINELKI